MASPDPFERIYNLKREAAMQGLITTDAAHMVAGDDFIVSLLMHPRLQHFSIANLDRETLSVFGVRVRQGRVAPNALKLRFEIDG